MEYTYSLVIIATTIFALQYFKHSKKLPSTIPGPSGLPLLGNVHQILRANGTDASQKFLNFLSSLVRDYGGRSKISLGTAEHLVLADVKDVQKLLTSDVHVNKPYFHTLVIDPWCGVNLSTSRGETWKKMRKLLNPVFSFSKIENYIEVMDTKSKLFMNVLDEIISNKKIGESIYVASTIDHLTFDILGSSIMDVEINSLKGKNKEFVEGLEGVLNLGISRWISPWLYPELIWNVSSKGKLFQHFRSKIHSFIDNVIQQRKLIRKDTSQFDTKTTNQPMIDFMLDYKEKTNSITDTDIRSETTIFFAAGQETSATTLEWALARIGYHKEVQDKLAEEMDSIFQGNINRPITLEDLRKMDYTELVIKETMRLHSVIPLILRQIESDFQLDDQTIIPPGTPIILLLSAVHADPKLFPEPEVFDPERFTAENIRNRHPYAFVGFSLGPRMCIGHKFAMLEMKIALAHIIRKYKVHCADHPQHIPFIFNGALVPKHDIPFVFSSRS